MAPSYRMTVSTLIFERVAAVSASIFTVSGGPLRRILARQ